MTEKPFIEKIRSFETPICVFTNYKQGDKEYWHCKFKYINHPVNKKAALFKMSGAEQE